MAIAKVILNGEVQMDVTSDTVEANKLLEGETATKNDGTKVTGTFVAPDPVISSLSVTPTESAQTFNEASISGYKPVTVEAIASDYVGSAIPIRSSEDVYFITSQARIPSGYYSTLTSAAMPYAEISKVSPYDTFDSSTGRLSFGFAVTSSGYVNTKTDTGIFAFTTLSAQTITPTESTQYISSYRWLTGSQTIEAIASDYVGSAIPMRSAADMYANGSRVYAPSGYYSTAANAAVSSTSLSAITMAIISSMGNVTAELSYSAGYLTADGKKAGNKALPTLSASTWTPGSTSQTISSYRWLTGSQTIAAIPSSYIIPSGTSAITSNGTFDIASYASASVNVVPNLVSKSVTPTESEQVITAGSLYTRVDGSFKTGETQETAAKAFSQISSAASTLIADTYIISGTIDIYDENKTTLYQTLTINENDWEFSRISGSKTTILFSKSNTDNYIDGLAISYYSATGCALWYSKVWRTKLSLVVNLTFYTKDADGLSQVTVNAIPVSGGGEFYDVYKAIALNSQKLSYGISSFSEWLSTVSTASAEMLMNRNFDSNTTYTFSNLTAVPIRFYARYPYSSSAYYSQRYANERFIFEKATAFDIQAFYSRAQVVEVSAPECSRIAQSAFNFCRDLSIVSFPKVSVIYSYGFANCISLHSVDFPLCSTIWNYAFSNCTALTTASFPSCTFISDYAFYGCKMLRSISFPVCSSIITSAFYNCSALETLYLPACEYLGSQTFGNCKSVTTANFPVLKSISTATFSSCITLSEISCPELVKVYDFGFQNCKALKSVYFPKCTRIERYAFQSCTALETVDFPICSTIAYWAFSCCSNLKNISFPSCVTVGEYAFCSCTALEKAVLPSCQCISSYAFESCFSLSYVDIPICSIISTYAFYSCSALATVYAPSLKTIGTSAFRRCLSLSSISFPSLESIGEYAFDFCNSLMSVYLFGSSMPLISTINIFRETPIINSVNNVYGSIYVPASLYDSYISAPNWSYYSARIVSLTDEQMDPIIHCGDDIFSGEVITATSSYNMYTASGQFSYFLSTGSDYVAHYTFKYRDTNGSYHLLGNTPGVKFTASYHESQFRDDDRTWVIGFASDHAAFLWSPPSAVTDQYTVSDVTLIYNICEYNV